MGDALDSLREMLAKVEAERQADAKRYESLDEALCQLCFAYGEDKRSLFISCFYAVNEVIPEAIDLAGVEDERIRERGYYLRICKACRGRLLGVLAEWRRACVALRPVSKDHDGLPELEDPERCIPVRVHGAVVMMTEDEYAHYRSKHSETEVA